MTETQTVDLAAWLTRIWDEEEAAAEGNGVLGWLTYRNADGSMQYTTAAAQNEPEDTWVVDGKEVSGYASAQVVYDWRQVLARIAADRKILELHARFTPQNPVCCECGEPVDYPEPWPCGTLRLLASPYKGREGWQEEWE